MDKRRMIIGLLILLVVPIYIWIAYFEIPDKAKVGEEKLQQDPLTHDYEKMLSFRTTYMGDASNTNAFFEALPLNEHKGTVEMDLNRFYLLVHYPIATSDLDGIAEQAVIYNTTAAFVLIGNLQEIELKFQDQSFKVTRDRVEKWFGDDFTTLSEPSNFKEKVQQRLDDSSLNEWLAAYTEGE
ncbi:DUF4825 domain-containing protein [Sporosarcina sp. ITBMC105]